MILLSLLFCILMLVVLITWVKANAFLSFVCVAIVAGLLLGVPAGNIMQSVNKGIGDSLGSVVAVIIFGAMLGKIVAESGAAHQISGFMRKIFGSKYIHYGMALTGLIIGIPLYYNVGFILAIPVIFSVAYQYKLPSVFVGLPMLTALSVMHGFVPPHPSPMTLIGIFHADLNKTFLYGLIISIPTIIIAGPVFAGRFRHFVQANNISLLSTPQASYEQLPGVLNSIISSLLPVILIAFANLVPMLVPGNGVLVLMVRFFGDPVVAMLITLVFTTISLGILQGKRVVEVMNCYTSAIKDISMILLIIGSAGALKQIFIDSRLSLELGEMLAGYAFNPLILAWVTTALLRVCLGSATVAGLTAAGILYPLAAHQGVNPNLLVLSIGAGSLFGSHVNDSAFWLYKEYFHLTLKETFKSWTAMESMVAVLGLCGVLLLDFIT
ncbi:gluconate:H+ symporter [Mucilaginibacter terrae]|uniref:Gnt-I system high-affinity gluconate transporter n=1 Tax=Mucilaginibacter terrae TaxID=1955052 RepID=A0ABU3H0B6_9SPHI|nr:gluconate:H+ symporter [Mucilaginibacter terrae]MDT3405459.1 Gnt-I system high-affinity gluconate transporter [Mucilaginibacter terrae]